MDCKPLCRELKFFVCLSLCIEIYNFKGLGLGLETGNQDPFFKTEPRPKRNWKEHIN